MKEFIINSNENNIRLDSYIRLKIDSDFSFLKQMERKKLVRVNKEHPANYKIILHTNDIISFYLPDNFFRVKNIKANFNIIYEDTNILIVDKEKGVKVHGDSISDHKTLIDLVTDYLIKKEEYIPSIKDSFRPAIVTRLDTNTKGLVLIAKNKDTLNDLNELISNGQIRKTYLALVKGIFNCKEGTLTDYIEINKDKNIVKVLKKETPDSKIIKTGYKVIKENNNMSLLEIYLYTGRLHQIRAHMSYYNHPVIGDNKYGDRELNKTLNINTQELISYKIEFDCGISNKLSYLKNQLFLTNNKIRIDN